MKNNYIVEFVPLIIFFLFYKLLGLKIATISLIISTIFFNIISYIISKKLNYISIFSTVLIAFFGGLSIYFDDMRFIKMKPSIINLLFASVLFIGVIYGKGLIKYIMVGAINMSEENWLKFSKRWSLFFFISAVLNEIVWRNFSENFWVKYKVFGSTILLLAFLIINAPFLQKNSNLGKKLDNR